MGRLDDLSCGRSIVYIMTRLFDYMEKIKAEKVEKAVINGLNRSLDELSIPKPISTPLTFVPFRDTAQNMIDSPNQTKIIYEQDLNRLNKLFMIVGFLDGLSKDEGICMELGYAFGIGAPSLIVVTDFIRRDFKEPFQGKVHLLDPILEYMASYIIYWCEVPNNKKSFLENLEDGLCKTLKQIEQKVYELAVIEQGLGKQEIATSNQYDVYLEFGGGMFEWERIFQEDLKIILEEQGLSVAVSSRYCINYERFTTSVKELGYQDIKLMLGSKVLVTCSDSIEMNSGTAALQGLARACNKKVILYDSKAIDIVGDNQYKSSRNLMIDCSSDKSVSNYKDIPETILKILKE